MVSAEDVAASTPAVAATLTALAVVAVPVDAVDVEITADAAATQARQ